MKLTGANVFIRKKKNEMIDESFGGSVKMAKFIFYVQRFCMTFSDSVCNNGHLIKNIYHPIIPLFHLFCKTKHGEKKVFLFILESPKLKAHLLSCFQ